MTEEPISRHILWRRQYDKNRYARHLSHDELIQRFRDLFINVLRLTPDAKIGLPPINQESALLFMKFTHIMEELQLRYGPYPNGIDEKFRDPEHIPNFASDLGEKAAKTLSSYGLHENEVFIKYGRREYMESLYEKGKLRIQPASYFSEKDHNGAVRDDELIISISSVLSREDIVKLVRNPQDVPLDAPEQRVDIRLQFPTDYWLYCVTSSVEPRLFVDFKADACVIIKDKDSFRYMLRLAAAKVLPRVGMKEGSAIYIDPLLHNNINIFVPFTKHFRYTYQEEYRFCWIPMKPVEKVEHVDVEIGSLKDIAELIVL